jgi:hypothetical protein
MMYIEQPIFSYITMGQNSSDGTKPVLSFKLQT